MSRSLRNRSNDEIRAREIKRIRDVLDLSKERFAQLLSVSSKTIFRWENDESLPAGIKLQTLQTLHALVEVREWREAILSLLDSRGIPATASILDALNAAFAVHDPQLRQQLVKTILNGQGDYQR